MRPLAGMVVRQNIWSAFTVVAVIGGLAFGNLIFDSLLAVTSLSNFGYFVIVGVFLPILYISTKVLGARVIRHEDIHNAS